MEEAFAQPRQLTLAEYEALIEPDESWSELSRGWLVREPRPGYWHSHIAGRIYRQLHAFVEERKLGHVTMEAGYRLSEHPVTVRGPDIAFVRAERMPAQPPRRGFLPFGPDFVIEVLSPANTVSDLHAKILEYFESGAAEVWVIDPLGELAMVYRSLSEISILRKHELLRTRAVLAGFELDLATLLADE